MARDASSTPRSAIAGSSPAATTDPEPQPEKLVMQGIDWVAEGRSERSEISVISVRSRELRRSSSQRDVHARDLVGRQVELDGIAVNGEIDDQLVMEVGLACPDGVAEQPQPATGGPARGLEQVKHQSPAGRRPGLLGVLTRDDDRLIVELSQPPEPRRAGRRRSGRPPPV